MTELLPTGLKTLVDLGADVPEANAGVVPELVESDLIAGAKEGESVSFEEQPADLAARLSGDVALLCVSRGAAGRITLTWHDGGFTKEAHNRPVDIEVGGKRRSVADIVNIAGNAPTDAVRPWEAAYEEVADVWEGVGDLGTWVSRYRAQATGMARLIIWDATGEDIPWEMYFGDLGPGAKCGWLGVTMPVSRWIDGLPDPDMSRVRQHDASGGVLLFDDWETHGERRDDYTTIEGVRVGKLESEMTDLLERLEGLEKFGLVLIRGHGTYGGDSRTFTMAGLPLIKLTGKELAALDRNHPAVLLSLCFSARTYIQHDALNQPVRGFVQPFLRRGASAVIAILAKINETHLHDVNLRLVADALDGPIAVSEWLQRHRAEYFRRLQNGDNLISREDRFRMFLTSCLYVCYCHPSTTLRILAEEQQ